jgi:hypothetical protein
MSNVNDQLIKPFFFIEPLNRKISYRSVISCEGAPPAAGLQAGSELSEPTPQKKGPTNVEPFP